MIQKLPARKPRNLSSLDLRPRWWWLLPIAAGLFSVAVSLAYTPSHLSLLKQARLITSLQDQAYPSETDLTWLSNDRFMVITTDRAKESDSTPWQGRIDLYSISEHRWLPLTALTSLFQRLPGYPVPDSASPDGSAIRWKNYQRYIRRTSIYVARLDGSCFRKLLHSLVQNPFWSDSTHLAGIYWKTSPHKRVPNGNPGKFRHPFLVVYDLLHPEKDSQTPYDKRVAEATKRQRSHGQPYELMPTWDMTEHYNAEIQLYHYPPGSMEVISLYSNRQTALYSCRMPRNAEALNVCENAAENRVIYHLRLTELSRIEQFINRAFKHYSAHPLHWESIWVSDANGAHLHELGRLFVRKPGEDTEIRRLEWLPKGKQVAFEYQHQLYTLPVP